MMPNEFGIPNPNACHWCEVDERFHAMRWSWGPGWHSWVAPADAQRLARMRARREARMTWP